MKSAEDKPSKIDEQKHVDMQTISSVGAASISLPLAGEGLLTCSNADTMSSA
jgi:hypothetical protein